MSDRERSERRRPARRGVPAVWRRGLLAAALLGLVAWNARLVRRQFPPDEQRRNEAYDLGLKALERDKDYAKAEIQFRRYLQLRDDPRVRILLGIALQAQDKLSEARGEFAAALEKSPGEDRARIGLAEIAQRDQDYGEAFRQIALGIADEPAAADLFLLRARLQAEVGDLGGAIATFQEAVRRDGAGYAAHLEMADLLAFRAQLTGSEVDRQAAAGAYSTAEALLKSRGTGDRRAAFALARAIAGQVATLRERDLSEAVKRLREVAAEDTADAEPTLLLGRILGQAGNQVEARRTFEDAAARWPTPATAIALHEYYAGARLPDLATKALEDAVQRHREDLGLRVRLVAWHVAQGRMEEAENEVANAETLLSDDWRVHEVRGDLARLQAWRSAALRDAKEAAARRAAAITAYSKALEGRPRSPRLRKKLAQMLIDRIAARDPDADLAADETRARSLIEGVLTVNAADAEALEWQARMMIAEGRAREAAESLRVQLDAPQPSLDGLRLLGAASQRIGDDRTAAAAFVRVLEILCPRGADDTRDARRAPTSDWVAAVGACVRAGRLDDATALAREAAAAWPAAPEAAVASGLAALARRDVAGAVSLLEDARTKFPREGGVRMLLAQAYEAAGRTDDAGRELEAAISDVGTDEVRLRYLDFLARTGRLENAEQGYLGLIAADPTNPAARLRLGDFYLATRPPRRDAALREYETARELAPRDPEPWLRIADLRLQEAKTDPQAFAQAETAAAEFESRAPGDPRSDYLRGKIALLSGRTDEALERLQRHAEALPSVAAGQYYLSLALQAAGRLEDALDPLERAARLAPGDESMRLALATLHFEMGKRAFEKGDFEAAAQLFARADAGGVGAKARLLVAGSAANAGKLDVSEAECRRVIAAAPENRAATQLLAILLLRKATKESLDEAEQLFRGILREDPDDLLSAVGLGTVKFAKGLVREALDDFRRVYPRSKSNPDVALAICQCHAALADLQGAVDFLAAESAAHPEAWDFPQIQGDFLVQLRQWEEAAAAYLEASRRAPDNPAPVLAAASALMQGRKYEEARALLVERAPRAKEPAVFAVALGDVLAHLGRNEEAQDQLRRALALAPGHPRALYVLGRIADQAGRGAEARKLYREAVERGSIEADCHDRYARILAADRDFAGARAAWLRALELSPRNPVYLNSLALATAEDEKRLEEALGYALQAATIAPERGEIADTAGWLLLRAGRVREAVSMLARAAVLLPEVAVVQFHSGMALSRDGRVPEARAALERALRLDPKFDGADAARAELDRLR